MNSRERIAYLRGLLDSMPREDKEARICSAIVDALDALASELQEQARLLELQREDCDSLADEVDELQEAVYELEDSFGVEPDSDYDDAGVDEDGLEKLTESYISTTCPSCAYTFYYKYEEGREDEKLVCPGCGEEFSRSV